MLISWRQYRSYCVAQRCLICANKINLVSHSVPFIRINVAQQSYRSSWWQSYIILFYLVYVLLLSRTYYNYSVKKRYIYLSLNYIVNCIIKFTNKFTITYIFYWLYWDYSGRLSYIKGYVTTDERGTIDYWNDIKRKEVIFASKTDWPVPVIMILQRVYGVAILIKLA